MKLQDLAINGISIFFLISLIVLAIRPQSNMIQIKQKPSPSQFEIEKETKPLLPQEVETDKVARE